MQVDTSQYKQYLDLNLVRRARDLPDPPGRGVIDNPDEKNLDQIKPLTDINLKQKAQIQSLVNKMNDMQPIMPQRPDPMLQQIIDRLDRLENKGATKSADPPSQPTPRQAMLAAPTPASAATHATSESTDSPAVAAMEQMADAMAQLSMSIDPSSARKAGQLLRPEYQYCVVEKGMPLRSVDASKLSINEYLYGMCLVMEHLVEVEGDWLSYFHHYKRVKKFFVGKKYVNAAYIGYDKEVVDNFVKNPARGFNASDSLAIPTHFCSANEHETQNMKAKGGAKRSRMEGRSRSQAPAASQPEDWPEEACFVYNTSFCNGSCGKLHICGKCLIRGHKMGTCRVKQEKN